MKDPRNVEPRLHAVLNGAPNWAVFLVLLVAASLDSKLVAAVCDLFAPATPDWAEDLGDGYSLLHFNGKTRTALLRETIPADVLARAEKRLAQYGLEIPDPDRGEREAAARDADKAKAAAAAAAAAAAKAAKANGGKGPTGPQVIQPNGNAVLALKTGETYAAGVSVQELVDRAKAAESPDAARKALLAIDGISPDVAAEILALASAGK